MDALTSVLTLVLEQAHALVMLGSLPPTTTKHARQSIFVKMRMVAALISAQTLAPILARVHATLAMLWALL